MAFHYFLCVFPGDITIRDVFEAFPFRNEIVAFHLKGEVIKEMLEHSVSEYDPADLSGRFLQMSGKLKLSLKREVSLNDKPVRILAEVVRALTFNFFFHFLVIPLC